MIQDEVVKLSPHARAIRDVEDEELRSFFYGMSPWQVKEMTRKLFVMHGPDFIAYLNQIFLFFTHSCSLCSLLRQVL